MELRSRPKHDRFLPDGAYLAVQESLRRLPAAGRPVVVVYAFDRLTVMLPYMFANRWMAPAGARAIGAALAAGGFEPVRIVLQQWTPNFDVRCARLDGRPVQMLCISSMQIHSARAIALVQQAHQMGPDRPLIVVGGPKAIYEPHAFFALPPGGSVEADVVVMGEEFVLLQMLERILACTGRSETLRQGFERARRDGSLAGVPGLVYRLPDSPPERPVLAFSGIQRLVRDLDELPDPLLGFSLLEKPHRRRQLQPAPLPAETVGRHSTWASLVTTHGCRFKCEYCPIPAYNQRTWRVKSPERLVWEIRRLYEKLRIRHFFGTDDNFFNVRRTAEGYFTAMARATAGGKSFAKVIDFSTEATEVDVYKNRDLLPLARKAGLQALYFGIEDLDANLINKGQVPSRIADLFAQMCRLGIKPMVMMMHYEGQPLRTRGSLRGLLNQVDFLCRHGAVAYQCTIYTPALGTRAFGPTIQSGVVFRKVGGRLVPDACYDGNHVVASRSDKPWQQQWNVLKAYLHFYNPLRLLETIFCRRDACQRDRALHQVGGHIALVPTVWRYLQWIGQLKRGPISFWAGLPELPFDLVHVGDGPGPGGLIQLALRGRQPALATA